MRIDGKRMERMSLDAKPLILLRGCNSNQNEFVYFATFRSEGDVWLILTQSRASRGILWRSLTRVDKQVNVNEQNRSNVRNLTSTQVPIASINMRCIWAIGFDQSPPVYSWAELGSDGVASDSPADEDFWTTLNPPLCEELLCIKGSQFVGSSSDLRDLSALRGCKRSACLLSKSKVLRRFCV